jgi:hypothetical protein
MTAPNPNPEQQAPERSEGWWAYPAVYALVVYCLALVPRLPSWSGLVAGLALAWLGRVVAHHVFHPVSHGARFAWQVKALATVAGVAAGVWLVAARLYGPFAVVSWLVAGTTILGAWHLVVLWLAPRMALAQLREPTHMMPVGEVALEVLYRGILVRAGSEDVQVTEVRVSPSGGVESVYLCPAPPSADDPKPKRNTVNRDQFAARLGHLVVELDQTLKRRPGRPVRVSDQDVHVEQGAGGSEWIMHVTVARPLEVVSRFVPADRPQPWCGAKKYGRYEDDAPLMITFTDEKEGAAHTESIIKTGGGKTGSLNVMVARHLEAGFEGRVWIVGTNKCLKLARPWLDPWLRRQTDRPVIDWVAGEEIWPVLRALASAYEYAVACNRKTKGNSARKPTRGAGALAVFMDEASDTLMRRETIMCCDGVKRNASELCDKIQQVGRTGPVGLHKFNQNALFESFGDAGSRQRRNIGIGIAGQCKAGQDAQRVIPGLPRANPMLLRKQAVFVEQAYEEPRELRARFDFIDDEDIPALAARYTPWQGELDPEITARMPYYADRWEAQWHPELIAELAAEGLTWPGVPAPLHTEPAHPERDDQEVPAVANTPRDPADRDPADMPDESIDLWAMFERETTGAAADPDDPGNAPSTLEKPNPKPMVDAFKRMAAWAAEHGTPAASERSVPEPLGLVLALLDRPDAPTDYVETERLAIATRACQAAGNEAAQAKLREEWNDPAGRKRIVAAFGAELKRQCPWLSSRQLSQGKDDEGRRVRPSVYMVAELREAATRLD